MADDAKSRSGTDSPKPSNGEQQSANAANTEENAGLKMHELLLQVHTVLFSMHPLFLLCTFLFIAKASEPLAQDEEGAIPAEEQETVEGATPSPEPKSLADVVSFQNISCILLDSILPL